MSVCLSHSINPFFFTSPFPFLSLLFPLLCLVSLATDCPNLFQYCSSLFTCVPILFPPCSHVFQYCLFQYYSPLFTGGPILFPLVHTCSNTVPPMFTSIPIPFLHLHPFLVYLLFLSVTKRCISQSKKKTRLVWWPPYLSAWKRWPAPSISPLDWTHKISSLIAQSPA